MIVMMNFPVNYIDFMNTLTIVDWRQNLIFSQVGVTEHHEEVKETPTAVELYLRHTASNKAVVLGSKKTKLPVMSNLKMWG